MGGAPSRPTHLRSKAHTQKRPVPMLPPTVRPTFCRFCNYRPLESRTMRCIFCGAHYLKPDDNWRQPPPNRLNFDGNIPTKDTIRIATITNFLAELKRQAKTALDLYNNGEEAPYIHPVPIGDCYKETYGDMPNLFKQGPKNKKTWIALSLYRNTYSRSAHAWVTVIVKSANGNARCIYFGDCDKDITRVAGRSLFDVLMPGRIVILQAALRDRRFTGTMYVYVGQRGYCRERRCLESACDWLAEIGMMADKAYTVGVDDERFAGFVKVSQAHTAHTEVQDQVVCPGWSFGPLDAGGWKMVAGRIKDSRVQCAQREHKTEGKVFLSQIPASFH